MESLTLREKLFEIIFGTDTPAGRNFDLCLIIAIVISVTAVLLDSVSWINIEYGGPLYGIEWFFTLLFTLEYLVRLYCSPNPIRYATSFFGIVDLLSILPSYFGLLYPDAKHLIVIRILRVLRIFRILKLLRYLTEANILFRALMASRRKIFVFLFSVLVLVVIFGSLMFIIEGPANGFSSIPKGMYWAIVTITTVGYGDITPQTMVGQAIAALAMITGYAIIAVPTGIISAELIHESQRVHTIRRCLNCERLGHDKDANFCKYCGVDLPELGQTVLNTARE